MEPNSQAPPPPTQQQSGDGEQLFDLVVPSVVHKRHVGVRFPNGAKCVVVEDPACHMASAAVTVRVGMNQDPPDVPGLAHFCEHMLFMGTAKYPQEDAFDNFVSKNGGHTNAWTEYQGTTYYFTTSDGVFLDALDRFLEFFVAPSFSPGAVAREMEAVHSEDEKNHSVDYWRLDELMRGLADPRHPYARYGNGNLTTLRDVPQAKGIDVRAQLLAFYNTYYVGEAMSIVMYSRHSVAEVLPILRAQLMRMRPGASPAVNAFVPPCATPAAYAGPFLPSSMRRVYSVVTKKQVRSVRLYFPYPDPAHQRHAIVSGYASHLIGHECSTSILGVLKNRGWATGLSAGGGEYRDDDDGVFQISVELTQRGFKHLLEVVAVVFRGVHLIHYELDKAGAHAVSDGATTAAPSPPPPTPFVQMLAEDRLQFEMSELEQTEMHCAQLSSALHTAHALPTAWLETVAPAAPDYAAAVAMVRRYLVPENCIVFLLWNGFPMPRGAPSTAQEEEDEEDAHAAARAGVAAGHGHEAEEEEGEEQEEEDEQEEDGGIAQGDGEAAVLDQAAGDGDDQNDMALFDALPSFVQASMQRDDLVKSTMFHRAVYTSAAIPDDVMAAWQTARRHDPPPKDGLAFPPHNRFLATEFAVYNQTNDDEGSRAATTTPQAGRSTPVTVEGAFGTMHVALSSSLRVPKIAVDLDVTSLPAYATPLHRFFTRVMVSVLKHNLTEIAYMGELASIANEAVPLAGGVGLRLDGPSHRMAEFLQAVVVQSVDASALKGTAPLFATYRDVAVRALRGVQSRQPSENCVDRLYALLVEKHYVFEDIVNAATDTAAADGAETPATEATASTNGASYDKYCAFVDEYLREMRYSLVVAGNVPSVEAAKTAFMEPIDAALAARVRCVLPKAAMNTLPYLSSLLIAPTVVATADACVEDTDATAAATYTRVQLLEYAAFNDTETNAATILELQLGAETPSLRVHADCFMKLVASSFFNALRTRETLGYVVYCRSSRVNNVATLRFVAQSARAGVDGLYLLSRILAFLDAVQASWPSVCTAQAVQDVVMAQVRVRQEPLKSIRELATEVAQDAVHPAGFQRRARELECLQSGEVSVATLTEMLRTQVANTAPQRRAVAVVVQAPQYSELVVARRSAAAAPATCTQAVASVSNWVASGSGGDAAWQAWVLPAKLKGDETNRGSGAASQAAAAAECGGGAEEEECLSLPTFDDGKAVAQLCLIANPTVFKSTALGSQWNRVQFTPL